MFLIQTRSLADCSMSGIPGISPACTMMAFRWGIVSVNGRSRKKFMSSPVNPAEIKPLNDGEKYQDISNYKDKRKILSF